jgi:hypothetical protein
MRARPSSDAAEHAKTADATEKRESELAERLVREHIAKTRRRLKQQFARLALVQAATRPGCVTEAVLDRSTDRPDSQSA